MGAGPPAGRPSGLAENDAVADAPCQARLRRRLEPQAVRGTRVTTNTNCFGTDQICK